VFDRVDFLAGMEILWVDDLPETNRRMIDFLIRNGANVVPTRQRRAEELHAFGPTNDENEILDRLTQIAADWRP
jgi:hypothetical protein